MSAIPDVQHGIEYWETQPASYDGVLGGFGTGSLPRVDSAGSRLFLLSLFPELSTIDSSLKPLVSKSPGRRIRALDVGAGVGRVTCDVLLHLVSDIVLLEPVTQFIQEALLRCRNSANHPELSPDIAWKGIASQSTSVTFIQGTLQNIDPSRPLSSPSSSLLDRIGFRSPEDDIDSGFDVIWCQWCLGHLSDVDLVHFFGRSHAALRSGKRSVMIVKENVCNNADDGSARSSFDKADSSLTRSDALWKKLFKEAGLKLVKEEVQEGLPEGLYEVKM